MSVTTMRADTLQVSGAAVDVSSLVGTWINAKPDTDYIAKIVIFEQDGKLMIQPYGATATGMVDWGVNSATTYATTTSTEAAGFHSRYEVDKVTTELAANEKLGVLVIQSYTSFDDGSDRISHYAREFFHRSTTGATGVGLGAHSLAGTWVNTNPQTAWLSGFTLAGDATGLTMHATSAASPHDWGESPATPYLDNIGHPAFHADYDLGEVRAILAANSNQGLIIVAAFLKFPDSDQQNFLCREFFYRPVS